MQRRDFIKQSAIAAAAVASTSQLHASKATPTSPIAKRTLGKTDEQLSIIGFGGIVVMDDSPSGSANIVAEAHDRGINYFDVAPSYGNAQERLGPALAPYRNKSFLACKTEGRMKDDSRKQLEESLRLLKTDHLDLYQFHALTKMTDLDKFKVGVNIAVTPGKGTVLYGLVAPEAHTVTVFPPSPTPARYLPSGE